MITKNDIILLLTELQENNVNVAPYLKKAILGKIILIKS